MPSIAYPNSTYNDCRNEEQDVASLQRRLQESEAKIKELEEALTYYKKVTPLSSKDFSPSLKILLPVLVEECKGKVGRRKLVFAEDLAIRTGLSVDAVKDALNLADRLSLISKITPQIRSKKTGRL